MICKKCGKDKELSEFYFRAKLGIYHRVCKECINGAKLQKYHANKAHFHKLWKEHYDKNKKKIQKKRKVYYKKYPWKKILQGIKSRCNNKNVESYKNYGARGIKCLITEEELKQLWFRDKAYLMKKPSIDRIDNDGNYTFENCQFIEMSENSKKSNKLRQKTILQFDLEGNFIKEWESQRKIARTLKISQANIQQCLSNRQKIANNYIWRYK